MSTDWSPATGDPRCDALIEEAIALRAQLRTRFLPVVAGIALPPDLTMRQFHVLLNIAAADGSTVHELSERFGISTPTASGIVDRLVDKALLTKVADTSDRRIRRLALTEQGHEVLNQLDASFRQLMGEAISCLNYNELVVLRDYSALLLDAARRLSDDDTRT